MTGTAARTSAGTARKIRVLIVDDSAMMRGLLTEIINSQSDMQAVGSAADPIVAREMIKSLCPDVLTLDVEMPKMDGLEFLSRLMALRPMPVVMVSTLTEKGSEITLRALQIGAIDFVSKPKLDIAKGLCGQSEELLAKIRVAAVANVRRMQPRGTAPTETVRTLDNRRLSTEKLIVIGASTGGTEALREVLTGMPPDAPGILIVQHMPEGFTRSFADRLNEHCRISVREAGGGERILPGHAYIAPGHSHLLLSRSGANYVTELAQTEPVNRHRPAVDVLFRSAARHAGPNAIGIILTGMGKDGAQGLLEMKRSGAYTLAQDEQSCVVFGMPKEAITLGAAEVIRPLSEITRTALTHLRSMGHTGIRV